MYNVVYQQQYNSLSTYNSQYLNLFNFTVFFIGVGAVKNNNFSLKTC
jgi:hypothetical protein